MSGPIPTPNESARNTALRKFSDATPNLPGTLRVLIGFAAAAAGEPVLPTTGDQTNDGAGPGLVSAITTAGVTVQVPTAGFIAMTSAVDTAAKTGAGAPDSWIPDPAANSMWQVADSTSTQITAVALVNSAAGSAAFTARVDLVDGTWTYTFVEDQTPAPIPTSTVPANTVESQT